MSRRDAQALDLSFECIVGWDPPLATYFAQVHDTRSEDDEPLMWIGTSYAEIPTVADLAHLLSEWAVLTPELTSRLERDRLDKPAGPRRLDLEELLACLEERAASAATDAPVELDVPDIPL